jgi:hypothetical protein
MQVDVEEVRKLRRVDAAAISQQDKLTEMDLMAVVQNDSTFLEVRGQAGRCAGQIEAHAVEVRGDEGLVMCCCWYVTTSWCLGAARSMLPGSRHACID